MAGQTNRGSVNYGTDGGLGTLKYERKRQLNKYLIKWNTNITKKIPRSGWREYRKNALKVH